MSASEKPTPSTYDYQTQMAHFFFKWTPRVLVAAISGYYCLGYAYEKGLMAAIDKVAISILKSSVGYAGLGAMMPTFQWYSAWGVRMTCATAAGVTYDLTERLTLCIYHRFKRRNDSDSKSYLLPSLV